MFRIKVLSLMLLAFCAASAYGQSKEILGADFEKGNQKWEARGTGGVSIRTTDKQAASGKKSLHVKGRTAFWQGAQLNLTNVLKAGVSYKFKILVKLEAGSAPAAVKLTLQRGDDAFYSLSAKTADDTGWTTLNGSYRPDGKDPYMLVFVESEDDKVSFYIDDFSLEAIEVDADRKGTVLKTDFQDGTPQNWLIYGDGLQVFSGQIGNNVVLKVDGRSKSADGLALDVTPYMFRDRKYRLSVMTFLGGGPPKDAVRIRVMWTDPDGRMSSRVIAESDAVTDSAMTKLSGEYDVPGEGSFLVIIEANGPKTSFFIDDFELEAL